MQALAGLVEIPAIALAMFIIMRVGKKWILCSTMFFAGIACLCIAVCEGRHLAQWVKTLLLMIGRCTRTSTAHIPSADCLFIVNRIFYQLFHQLIYLCKICCFLFALLYPIAGKFTISAGNTVMPVYTAELYPTAIRNAGVGACNVAAGVALIIVPYLSLLVWRSRKFRSI